MVPCLDSLLERTTTSLSARYGMAPIILTLAIQPAIAAQPEALLLDPIEVRPGGHVSSLTVPDAAKAGRMLQRIPGNVSLVSSEDYRDSAVISLRDALSLTPGVYVQNPAGQEATKLSIRGSGLSTAFAMRGVRLLRDGLPLSRSDGYADTTWADPYTASHIEIYRGANALRYGASTLGGAINLVSPTGYSHSYTETRLEVGSNAYLRAQARTGQAWENGIDAFVSAARFSTDGSREHAQQKVSRFYGNLGYRFSAASEGRLHLGIERNEQQFPGALTLAQLHSDSGQASAGALRTDEHVALWPRVNIAYQHAWHLGDNNKLMIGAYYTATRFDYPNANVRLTYDSHEHGVSLRHEITRTLAGRENHFVWGANLGWGRSHNETFGPVRLGKLLLDPRDVQFENIRGSHATAELFFENSWQATPALTVVTGAQVVHATREGLRQVMRQPLAMPLFTAGDSRATYTAISPKVGLLWQLASHAQMFANLSRSTEPPTGVEFHSSIAGVLQAQRATTLEVGMRGQYASPRTTPTRSATTSHSLLGWELAAYHSRIRHELLGIEFPPGSGRFITNNIDETRHSGLEAGLHGSVPAAPHLGDVEWRVIYTYSRYRITDAPAFVGNTLPGIAPHTARVDLTWRHPSGWYMGPSFEFASAWYADQANTLKAPGYGIINATIGYASHDRRLRAFLTVRNLSDKRYAATSNYLVAAAGTDAAVFNPGLSRSAFVGMQVQW